MLAQLQSSGDTAEQIPRKHLLELSASPDLRVNDIVTEDGTKKLWEDVFLIEMPIAAVNTNLSRLRNECFNLASGIINRLAQEAGASGFKFESMRALVNPKSNFVMQGSQYEADIFLVAANDQSNYKIRIGGEELPLKEGIGKYRAKAKGIGSHQLSGEIIMPGKAPIPFKSKWTSFKPAAIVSPVNMNVLYIGLDNPLEISVPGISPDQVSVRMEGGTLTKKNGTRFEARVNSGQQAKVFVSARLPDGSTQQMGIMDFRIKRVPNPKVSYGSLESGSHSVGACRRQREVNLAMEDFMFQGVSYTLLRYQMTVRDRTKRIKYNNLNISGSRLPNVRLEPGDEIILGGFVARGPGKPQERIGGKLLINVVR